MFELTWARAEGQTSPFLGKVINKVGGEINVSPIANISEFTFAPVAYQDLGAFAKDHAKAARDGRLAVVHGAPRGGRSVRGPRWSVGPNATLTDAPVGVLMVDVDHCVVDDDLPFRSNPATYAAMCRQWMGLHQAACFWSRTGSSGLDPGKGKLRLAFHLRERRTLAEVKRWAVALNEENRFGRVRRMVCDTSIYQAGQLVYVATPRFTGMADPMVEQQGMLAGEELAEIEVPPETPLRVCAGGAAVGSGGWSAHLAEMRAEEGGFNDPFVRAVGAFVRDYDCQPPDWAVAKFVAAVARRTDEVQASDPRGTRSYDRYRDAGFVRSEMLRTARRFRENDIAKFEHAKSLLKGWF